jgi:hypothetical protein
MHPDLPVSAQGTEGPFQSSKMLRIAPFALFVALCGPYCLSAQTIRFDYDHEANFSAYHSYRLVKIKEDPAVNQLADQRIQAAIEAELMKKGLQKVTTGGDVLVGYQTAIGQETQYTTFNDGVGPGWGWRSTGISTTTSQNIPVGTLAIDIMDPAKKQLVFRGTASGTLSDKPEKNADKINKSVKKIFDKYPPKGK